MTSAVVASPEHARFSRDIAAKNLKPLWERTMRLSPCRYEVVSVRFRFGSKPG